MAQKNKDYSRYEVYDFLMDPHFKQWALEGGMDQEIYWKDVRNRYPEKEEIIIQAKQLAINLKTSIEPLVTSRKSIWENIEQEINTEGPAQEVIPVKPLFKKMLKYAAILFLIAGTYAAYWFNQSAAAIKLTSGYGETKQIILPDSSIVQLGANSVLSYRNTTDENHIREVWISGEAKFQVKHLNKNPSKVTSRERFVVHMNNAVDVEVLGTIFSVNDRRGKTAVHLESGKVKIIAPNVKRILKPGETAQLDTKSVVVLKKEEHPTVVHKWQNNTLLMNKTSIAELLLIMEDTYGIHIRVDSQQILEKKLDGVLPLNDEQKALMIISSISGTNINHQENEIILSPR